MSEKVGEKNTLWDKVQKAPFVPLGMLGAGAMTVYAVRDYKFRPRGMSTSVYVMQYRVIIQSCIVGAMTLGVSYALVRDFINPPKKDN